MLKLHLVLHHSIEYVLNEDIQDRPLDRFRKAISVRKYLVEEVSWLLQIHDGDVLDPQQLLQSELVAPTLVRDLLHHPLDLAHGLLDSKGGEFLLKLERVEHLAQLLLAVQR